MAWNEGKQLVRSDLIDWNEKFKKELVGELDEETARITLGKFLMFNIGFFVKILTGVTLAPYQRLVIKGWFQRNFILTVAGRGAAKSTLASVFAYLYCLTHKNSHVLLVSATFRSSRQILEKIDMWSKNPEKGQLLRQCFMQDMTKKQDLYSITFKNGSKITAVPLGDSQKLRGFRCNVLIIDEGLLISAQTIDEVLKPFLIAGSDITDKQDIREREDALIAQGLMKEEERKKFHSSSKMIILSSASYKWEHLFTIYSDYLKKIYKTEEDGEKINEDATYLVQQFSYEIVPPEILDPAITSDINSGSTPKAVLDREYKAIFTDASDGYFSAEKMSECTIPAGMTPAIEIQGDPKAKYILSIDPNVSASASSDHFAMVVLKEVKKDNRLVPLMVHGYAAAGVSHNHHIDYLIYLLENFNIVYIALDATQGSGMDFIGICNSSEQFKKRNIELFAIEADFGKLDSDEIAKQVRKEYSLTAKRIVQKQVFHSDFQRAANEFLKASFDFKRILFASKALSIDGYASSLAQQNIGDIHETHPLFEKDGLYGFIENQDMIIDLTKKECAIIEPRMSVLGNVSFDMPQNIKRTKGAKRTRKDLYSALFLGNWAFKIYQDAMGMPEEKKFNSFTPFVM